MSLSHRAARRGMSGPAEGIGSGRGGGMVRRMAGLAGWALYSSLAFAADDGKVIYPASAPPPGTPEGSGLGALTLVAGLMLAALGAWLVWRGRLARSRTVDGRTLAIVETRPLGNRQYLVVAAYEDKKFLLGVCPGRIDLLAPLHDEKARV